MDTREKIVAFERLPTLLEGQNWIAIAAAFDPLTATEAQRLAKWKAESSKGKSRRLLALVLESKEDLLPAIARASLIAALRCVDLVSVAPVKSAHEIVAGLDGVELIADPEGDSQRTADLIDLVLKKQNGQYALAGDAR